MTKSIKDSYLQYTETTKNDIVEKSKYQFLTAEFNKFLMNKVKEGKKVTLPSRLGTLQIIGKKQKIRYDEEGNVVGLAPDWVKTKELWEKSEKAKAEKKKVYHLNSHTNQVRYKYFWSKARVLIENKTLYSLRMTRANKRAVNKNIIEKRVNYVTKS